MKSNIVFCVLMTIFLVSTIASSLRITPKLREKRIIRGEIAEPDQFSYTVALIKKINDGVRCSGSIIGYQFILTAAHCAIRNDQTFFPIELLLVVIGTTSLMDRRRENEYMIEKVYLSKMFDSPEILKQDPNYHYADIAVLKLSSKIDVEILPHVRSLYLPLDERIDSLAGKTAIVSGFGLNTIQVQNDERSDKEIEDGTYSNALTYAEATILSYETCQLLDNPGHYDICARISHQDPKNPKGTCTGDSGGPLVYKGMLVIGVLSASYTGCNETVYPATYTNVWNHLRLIKNAMAGRITQDMRVFPDEYDTALHNYKYTHA